MTSIGAALHQATNRLRPVSPTARLDAELLLAHALAATREQIVAELAAPLAPGASAAFWALIERRAKLEPVAYLLGRREFYGLEFYVDQRVLVPRPETELVVDLALRHAARRPARSVLHVADIGTGSGAIAIAVAAHLPGARVTAVDISEDALAVARINVERHGLGDRIVLLQGSGLRPLPGPVDLLLSNPPYMTLDEVDENVRRHEPHLALDGGEHGLAVIKELFVDAPHYLVDGVMVMEIAPWQGEAASALAAAAFPRARIAVHQDLGGLDRILEISLR